MSDPSEETEGTAGGRFSGLVGWLKLIALFLFLKWALVDVYMIPSGSMEPTLHGVPGFLWGDRVTVNKLAFGPRIPFTTSRILPFGAPKRWDVVVFRNVEPNYKNKILIKRIVGLPGERVHIAKGNIHINGEVVEPPEALQDILHYTDQLTAPEAEVQRAFLEFAQARQLPTDMRRENAGVQVLSQDILTFNERIQHLDLVAMTDEERTAAVAGVDPLSLQVVREWIELRLAINPEVAKQFQYGILTDDAHSLIPEGHYFLLGDNSAHSKDGRFFGWVPRKNLYGRAFAVVLPPTHLRDLSGFTSTWSGMAILIFVPAFIILFEVTRVVRQRRTHSEKGD